MSGRHNMLLGTDTNRKLPLRGTGCVPGSANV